MKKLSVNDLHKSLQNSLGEEFKMNEVDFSAELTANKDYRDFVFNQIIPAIDSEFTPDLAREIEADLKKKDSPIGSTSGYGASVGTISPEVDPPNKKQRAKYFAWEDRPFLGAKTPTQYLQRQKTLNNFELELGIFKTNFIDNVPGTAFGVIDQWNAAYGAEYLGEFLTSSPNRDDKVSRGVMEQKAISQGLDFLNVYFRTEFPNGLPDEVAKGIKINEALGERAFMINMHERITDYIKAPTESERKNLFAALKVNDESALNEWYESNAEALLELDDMGNIEVAQPLPEVTITADGKMSGDANVPNVGFSGSAQDAAQYLKDISETDSWKNYIKYEQSRSYFISKVDEFSVDYPEYSEKIANQLKVQQVTDAQSKIIDEAPILKWAVKGIKSVSRAVQTVVHGSFEVPKSIHNMMGGKVSDSYNDFLNALDPDNNRFTAQSSRAKRIGFEYQLDLGMGYTAVYDAKIEDAGKLQYIIAEDGYMVHSPVLVNEMTIKADKLIADGAPLEYDFNAASMSTQSFQALLDVGGMILGGEIVAGTKIVNSATTQSMKLSNWLRSPVVGTQKPITAARVAQKSKAVGSMGVMYLQMHHGIYDQAIMNGMTSREADYYAMGTTAAITLINRINPEMSLVRDIGKGIKNFEVSALVKGLSNRDVFKAGMIDAMKKYPKGFISEAVEERYLERMGQGLVGAAMQGSTPKNLQIPEIEIFSLKEMDEFFIGGIVGGKMKLAGSIRTHADISRVHQELMYKAYKNQDKTFATLENTIGSNMLNADDDVIPVTEEYVKEKKESLQEIFAKFDKFKTDAKLNNSFFTEEQEIVILQQIALNEAYNLDEDTEFKERGERMLEAMLKDPSVVDATFTSPFTDAYEAAKKTTSLRELDSDVAKLMGIRDTDNRPNHIKSLAKLLESNFENVPVFIDKNAFRAFMIGIGVEESNINKYRGVYDSVHKSILINPETATLGTPIHEYSHVWLNYVRDNNPELYKKMESLVKGSPELMGAVGNDAFYQGQESMEALVIAIEKRAEEVVSDPDLLAKIKDAVKEFFAYLAEAFNVRTDNFGDMTLQQFVDQGAYEVLTGDFKVGGTIESLPAQNTTINSNVGNTVNVLTNLGRAEGTLAKNKAGEFIVQSRVGDVVVARPDEGVKAIGDMGILLSETSGRIKLVPAVDDQGNTSRLVEIDGRMHLINDDSLVKDNQGRSYGLVLQDEETGQEAFFSMDNEITQEIVRKAVAGKHFSKVPESADLFQIGIAPFKNNPISIQSQFEDALETPQYQFFVNTIQEVASELGVKINDEFASLGGYRFEKGEYINEVSRVLNVTGKASDVEVLTAVMGILAPEQQESVMLLEVGESVFNSTYAYDVDPELGAYVMPESVWSESFSDAKGFVTETLRQDFDNATGLSGRTINEEIEDFEQTYGRSPVVVNATEGGVAQITLPFSLESILGQLQDEGFMSEGYPFINSAAIDAAFTNVYATNNINISEGFAALSIITSVFSRIQQSGLIGQFMLNTTINSDPQDDVNAPSMYEEADSFKRILTKFSAKTVGQDLQVSDAFRSEYSYKEVPVGSYGTNVAVMFNHHSDSVKISQDQPLALTIGFEPSELEGEDKVEFVTKVAKGLSLEGYSYDLNTDKLHIFVNRNSFALRILKSLGNRNDIKEISYAKVKPRFKSQYTTRSEEGRNRASIERGYFETIKEYRSNRPNLADERPNLHNALSVAEEAFVRDEAHRTDNRSMINAPVKIEWNDSKRDYMIGGMTMQQYGFRYGLTNFGGVSELQSVNMGGGVNWEIPGGIGVNDEFTYAELIWMKEQGWNPNDIKDEFIRSALYRKLARTHTQGSIIREVDDYIFEGDDPLRLQAKNALAKPEDQVVMLDPVDNFNRFIFGMLSPNQPLTPNEMQVAAMRVQGIEDEESDEAIRQWFGGNIMSAARPHSLPGDIMAEGFSYRVANKKLNMFGRADTLNVSLTFDITHNLSNGETKSQRHSSSILLDSVLYIFEEENGNRPIDLQTLTAITQGVGDLESDEIELLRSRGINVDNVTRDALALHDKFKKPYASEEARDFAEDYRYENYFSQTDYEFVRVKLVEAYTNSLVLKQDESSKKIFKYTEDAVEASARNEQVRLNEKSVDPIFRASSDPVRARMYLGVANFAPGQSAGSFASLQDGTIVKSGSTIFFHGTKFFFDKLDRVQEAKGAGTMSWNKNMKPTSGFTPFISPSYYLASGFKGDGGEVLSVAVNADAKIFDPALMGNVFGKLLIDAKGTNSINALSITLEQDIQRLARGEETQLPMNVVGLGLMFVYGSNNSSEEVFESMLVKKSFDDLEADVLSRSTDSNMLRALALQYINRDTSEYSAGISEVIGDGLVASDTFFLGEDWRDEYNKSDVVGLESGQVTHADGIFEALFYKALYKYAVDEVGPELTELISELNLGSIKWGNEYDGIYYQPKRDGFKGERFTEGISMLMALAENNFRLIEQPYIVDFIDKKGFDGFVVREDTKDVANIAITNPDMINLKYDRGAPGIPRLRQAFTAQDVSKVTIQGLANMYPKDASESLNAEEKKELNKKMKTFFNMQKMDEGGLGLAGSADLANVARFAKMYLQDPSFFMKKKMETWVSFLERVQNQVPGLSSKTGSFSLVWQDPGTAAISAMDRHMLRIFEKDLFKDKEVKAEFERMVVQRWNAQVDKADAITNAKEKAQHYKNKATMVRPGAKKADSLDDVMAQYEFGKVGAMYMEVGFSMLSNNPVKFRYKSGEVNPTISVNLQGTNFIVEPDKVQSVSDNYMRMLSINEEKARQSGLSVFMSQWALWDKARNRFEPHAMMFPGLHKLPRMSFTNLNKARSGHRDVGYFNSSKVEKFNEELGELTKELKPVRKAEPGSLLYFSTDPYRGMDLKQAKEIVNKHKAEGMTSDMIREAFIRGGMDVNVADSLVDVAFNPEDPTIGEKLRRGFVNFGGNLSQETSEEITENAKKYLPRSNKITSADAYLMLEQMGVEGVYDLLMNPTAMSDERLKINKVSFANSEVRVVLTRIVAEEFDRIANQMMVAGEADMSKEYRAYAAQVMDVLIPELTQKGRFIQAASILAKTSSNYYVQNINNRLRTKGQEPLSDEDSETIRRLHSKMKNAPDGLPKIEAESEMMRFISRVMPVGLYDILENQYYANLLSGYGTNAKNIFGSLNQIIFEGITEAAASTNIKDAGAFYMGMFKGVIPALNVLRYIMSTGIQYGYTQGGKFDERKMTEGMPIYEYMSPNQFTGDNKFTSSLTQSDNPIAKFVGHVSTGIGRGLLTVFNPKIMKYFGRALIGTDVAFATMSQSAQMELMKQRLKRNHKFAPKDLDDKAKELLFGKDLEREARYQGYATQAENEGFKQGTPRHRIRVFELARKQEVSETMDKDMRRKGQEYTFNYDPDGFLGATYASLFNGINKAKEGSSTSKVIVGTAKTMFIPFARILVNVANRGYAYSPLGFLKQSAGITTKFFGEKARKMEAGSWSWTEVNDYEKSLARGRATIGTLLTLAIAGLTQGDDDDEENLPWLTITGAGPSDYNKRYQMAQKRMFKPFTITVNRDLVTGEILPAQDRKSVEYRDSMVFLTLAAVGTIRDHERFGNDTEAERNRALSTAVTYATSMMSSMAEQSFVQGLAGLFKEVQPSGSAANQNLEAATEGLVKKIENYGLNTISGLLVPNIIKQATRTGRAVSNRAIQQKVGSMENPEGYLKDIFRDLHMIDPEFPILDHFGRPVVPTYDNYIPVLVQPRQEETGVYRFFRKEFLDNNIIIPRHKFPEYINDMGEVEPMTRNEELMYFALRNAFIYDGLDELRFDENFDFVKYDDSTEAIELDYPFATDKKVAALGEKQSLADLKTELSRVVSEANDKAERYVESVKFGLPYPDDFELPQYILEDAPYGKELFKNK